MKEIIKIDSDNKVSGRELHEFLEVGRDFTTWMKQMIGYGFSEHTDYETCSPNLGSEIHGGHNKVDYVMTIDMAKEICMIQRTERGKQARQYFLECEKRLKEVSIPHDSYMITDPIKRALAWAEEEKVRQEQAKLIEESKPKALFADAVASSSTSILIRDLAKVLHQNGIKIGQNRMFDWLRDHGYLIKRGSDKNMPTQRAMELKLFHIKEGTYIDSNGNNITTKTPKVTGKGQIYFVNKFLSA